MKRVTVALIVAPMVAACSTGSVVWRDGTATATAEAVSAETAEKKAGKMLSAVCQPINLDSAIYVPQFVPSDLGDVIKLDKACRFVAGNGPAVLGHGDA